MNNIKIEHSLLSLKKSDGRKNYVLFKVSGIGKKLLSFTLIINMLDLLGVINYSKLIKYLNKM